MKPTPIVLIGAGGHARACIDVIEQEGSFVIAGLAGLPEEVGSKVLGYEVLGVDDDPALFGKHCAAVVTVGQIKTPEVRMRLFAMIEAAGAVARAIVSPRAYVSRHASVGEGTIVLHGAVVNAGAVVGRNCIINSQSLIEHDAIVGDHCHIATSASVNSGVKIGNGTFLGSGAVVRQGLTIGERCVIAMGQRVLSDCESGTRMLPPRAER